MTGVCEDGLSFTPTDGMMAADPMATNCAPGTDCSDCGTRAICTSCPAECAARISNGHNSFCLEEMFQSRTICYEACNNRECLHGNGVCNTEARYSKCVELQEAVKDTYTTIPMSFDATSLETTASSADGSTAPLSVSLSMSQVQVSLNSVSSLMEASFNFHLIMQWQDSRLEVSPCAAAYATTLSTQGTSPKAQLVQAENLLDLFWHPAATFMASDQRTSGTVVVEKNEFKLESNGNWSAGRGPIDDKTGLPYEACHKCATYTEKGTATILMAPSWTYHYFPFDRHNLSFVISIPTSNMSTTCAYVLDAMGLNDETARSAVLPSTQEWIFMESYTKSVKRFNPGDDVTKCEVLFLVKRNGFVFIVKQLAISVLVVFSGLLALYLHVGDHTGDRTALILVAALICTTSFQTDLKLGPVQYLIWFDYWNVAQLAILMPCLGVALYEHRCWMSDRAEWATTLNKATRWVIPFGYYPVMCAALFLWGMRHDDPPSAPTLESQILLGAGFALFTILFCLQLRREMGREKARRRRTANLLRSSDTTSPNYINVLREAFDAFDMDNSGDISMGELRELLEIIFPNENRLQLAEVMKEARKFSDRSDNLDENSFIDAVLIAVKGLRKHHPEKAKLGKQSTMSRFGSMRHRHKEGTAKITQVVPYDEEPTDHDNHHGKHHGKRRSSHERSRSYSPIHGESVSPVDGLPVNPHAEGRPTAPIDGMYRRSRASLTGDF